MSAGVRDSASRPAHGHFASGCRPPLTRLMYSLLDRGRRQMALSSYAVVKGDFDHFTRDPPDDFGRFLHGHIFIRAPNEQGNVVLFDCACDVNTPSGWIDYFHIPRLDPDKFLVVPGLPAGRPLLPTGHHAGATSGGALDVIPS